MYLKSKALLAFAFMVLIFSSTAWSADDVSDLRNYDFEPGIYNLQSISSYGYLNSRHVIGGNILTSCINPEGDSIFQWDIQPVEGHYTIRSVLMNAYLDSRKVQENDIPLLSDIIKSGEERFFWWDIKYMDGQCVIKSADDDRYLIGRVNAKAKAARLGGDDYNNVVVVRDINPINIGTDIKWDIQQVKKQHLSVRVTDNAKLTDGFPEEGALYTIKNKYNGNCLTANWGDTGMDTVRMENCVQNEHTWKGAQLWYFEKNGEYYRIRNEHTRSNCLYDFGKDGIKTQAGMQVCAQGQQEVWNFEKDGECYFIKNKYSRNCLNSWQDKRVSLGFNTVATQTCVQKEFDEGRGLWCFEKLEHEFYTSHSAIRKKNILELTKLQQDLAIYKLFTSSFLSGAAYSLIPEVIRDGVEFSGYPKAANVAALVIQGGMVAYNAASSDPLNPYSYASTVTGMAARYGSSYFLSKEASAIAGSTAAVVTTVLLSPETTVDCMTRCSIALVGSYAGSTLALKAKSWIYGLWSGNGETSKEELVSALSTLQKILVEKDKVLKEKEDEIKWLKELEEKRKEKIKEGNYGKYEE